MLNNWKKLIVTVLLVGSTPLVMATQDQDSGTVYAMSNNAEHNEILVYSRGANGILALQNMVSTEGRGSGGEEPLEPVDALGSQAPLIVSNDGQWLFAVNAGSDEISVFRIIGDYLMLTDKVSSGGFFPVSLALHKDLLYVLNSGGEGNIAGFSLSPLGKLTAIENSTRSLHTGGDNPPRFIVSPAQVGFNPSGDFLMVTIKGTNQVLTYAVNNNGGISETPVVNTSLGSTPFGFGFDHRGHLILVEPFGTSAVGTMLASTVSSYEILSDGTLKAITETLADYQTATCWIAITRDGRYAYTTNNVTNTISGFKISADGQISLIDPSGIVAASGDRPVDIAISSNGKFVYAVNAGSGTISMFEIDASTGRLNMLGEVDGLPVHNGAVGIAAR